MAVAFVLRLLGPLRLEGSGGRLAKFPTKRSALILARIAITKDHRIGRDELAEVLWPDDYLDVTRLRLRQELRRLRQAIGEFGDHLRTDRQWVEIEPGTLTTDLQMFSDAMAAANCAPDPESKAAHLSDAVKLLDGQFLAGYQEPWVLATRREYEEKARRAWLSLADALQALNADEEALNATMNAVRHDPLDIDANASLIQRLVDRGQVARARQAFLEFDGMLYRELGYHAPNALRAPIGLAASERDDDLPLGNPISPQAIPRPIPIFGRSELLETILAALDRPGASVSLVGMIGVGKTHLVREAAWRLSRQSDIQVQVGGVPQRVADGLYLADAHTPRNVLIEQVRVAAANGWRILAESRTRIESDGITEIPVNPLPTPSIQDPAGQVYENASVQLLLSQLTDHERVMSGLPHIAFLGEIARRLDGHPGALKIFASRLKIQTPELVLRNLREGLTEFAATPDSVGESIEAVLTRLRSSLPPHAEDAFLALSHLEGAASDLAAILVQPHDPASIWRSLERNSLITIDDIRPALRYRVPSPIAFVVLNLASSEDLARVGATTWRRLADWAYAQSRKMTGVFQEQAFSAVQAEFGNLRRGIAWAVENDPALATKLVCGMWRGVCARGNPSVDADLLLRACQVGASLQVPDIAAEAYVGAGVILATASKLEAAGSAFLEANRIYRAAGNVNGAAWATLNYASLVVSGSDRPAAVELLRKVSEETDQPEDRAIARAHYAIGLAAVGEIDRAIHVGEEVFADRLQSDNITAQARGFTELAMLYHVAGRTEAALPLMAEGVRRLSQAGIQDILLDNIVQFAEISLDEPNVDDILDEADRIASRVGSPVRLFEIALVRLTLASRRLERSGVIAAVDHALRLAQINASRYDRERLMRVVAEELEKQAKPDYANAVWSVLGEEKQGPIHTGWKTLLSSNSHATVCVLLGVMVKESLATDPLSHHEPNGRGEGRLEAGL